MMPVIGSSSTTLQNPTTSNINLSSTSHVQISKKREGEVRRGPGRPRKIIQQ
jgi:hypothetical protein